MDLVKVKSSLDKYIATLNKTLNNFGKSPHRKYTQKFLLLKKKESEKINEKVKNLLLINQDKLTETELHFYTKATKQKFNEISQIISLKLEFAPRVTFKSYALAVRFIIRLKGSIMASIADIIKIASTLVPQYDGAVDKLPAVLSALTALNTLVTDVNRVAAIQVVLSRFEGKARVAVGDNPASINEISQSLKDKCDKRPQPETIIAKLNATKQTGDISQFAQKIETLTLELEKCYLAENVPVDTATKLATRAGVKALTTGIRSDETKTILKAGQFNTIASAMEKAIENEPVVNNQVLHVRSNNSGQRGNHNGYRENFQHQRGRQRGNDRNFRGRQQHSNYRSNYNHPGGNSRGYGRGYGRGNGRGNNRGNFQNQYSRVFYNSVDPNQMIQNPQSLGFQQVYTPQQQQQNQVVLAQPQQSQVALAQLVPRR